MEASYCVTVRFDYEGKTQECKMYYYGTADACKSRSKAYVSNTFFGSRIKHMRLERLPD